MDQECMNYIPFYNFTSILWLILKYKKTKIYLYNEFSVKYLNNSLCVEYAINVGFDE